MMGKRTGKPLTARRVATITDPGMHHDNDGLYLRVGKNGGRSWILRTVVFGRRRDLGLGSAKLVTLAEAREKAHDMRRIARSGGNPLSARTRDCTTFEVAAQRAFEVQKSKWSSPRHEMNWWKSIEQYALPELGDLPLDQIQTKDVHRVLEPIWTTKYDTARKVRQRISLIFDWAKGAGYYHKENPLNGISKALPPVRRKVTHHPAMKWQDLPDFMRELSKRNGVSARLMEFAILTCVRSGEARGAKWDEIHGDVWVVPPERMKNRQEHRVPLSKECLRVLSKVEGLGQCLIFPSPQPASYKSEKIMSDQVFNALMKRMGVSGVTMHGFRSTFKEWCNEAEQVDWDLSEKAIAHIVGSETERAYARSDLFDRRRPLMQAWSDFANSHCNKRRKFKRRPKSMKHRQTA